MFSALLLSSLLVSGSSRTADLVDTAAQTGGFETLLSAAGQAGLVGALRSAEALTILAPTDEAFAEVPEDLLEGLLRPENRDALARVLRAHVIPGSWSAAGLLSGREVATLEGSKVRFTLEGGRLCANEARLVRNDLAAANGVLHAIDRVLIPEGLTLAPARPSPAALIEVAVARGAPLYNRGQTEACAAIYEITARSLLMLGESDLGEAAMERLGQALAQAERDANPVQRSWTLRRALDEVWRSQQQEAAPAALEEVPDAMRTLFEFEPQEGRWSSVNDDVMGGISQGGFEQVDGSVAAFRGALSLANNGGFSTMRSAARDLDLGGWDGLTLRVRGDGRTYALSAMKSDGRGEIRTWKRSFETRRGEWQEIRIPFSELALSIMGRQFGQGIDPAEIRSLAFSISDKDETPFRLEIDWIRAWRGDS